MLYNSSVAGTVVERGSVVEAVVLDVAKAERLVDLSLRPEIINRVKEGSAISHTNKKVGLIFCLSICIFVSLLSYGQGWSISKSVLWNYIFKLGSCNCRNCLIFNHSMV